MANPGFPCILQMEYLPDLFPELNGLELKQAELTAPPSVTKKQQRKYDRGPRWKHIKQDGRHRRRAGENGTSCHICHHQKTENDIARCSVLIKRNRWPWTPKKCRKNVCLGCVERHFPQSRPVLDDWRCPSCCGLCPCPPCRLQRERISSKPPEPAEQEQ